MPGSPVFARPRHRPVRGRARHRRPSRDRPRIQHRREGWDPESRCAL